MEINRIAIIGMSGSGKSTAGRTLAQLTNLPLFHMDVLFWKGNWEAVPEDMYVAEHKKLVEKEQWIIEGYVDEAMANRLKRADLILYLDYSRFLCFWRILRRVLMHRNESRPELPKEALERFSSRLLWTVLTRGERVRIESTLVVAQPKRVVRVHSPRELEEFLKHEKFVQ